MIKNIHVTGVSVSDQDRALEFYTTKLGFETRADISAGGLPLDRGRAAGS
jgi:catechol 2,3-dioxygenase-like lactoylglutathione lyase family enzyme